MKVHIDSLVKGFAGTTTKTVVGRVYQILRNGSVALIDADGKQWIVNEPEVLDRPRALAARTDIPARLR